MFISCRDDRQGGKPFPDTRNYVDLNTRLPKWFSLKIREPIDNPTTQEGIEFGRALFYEPLLSADGTQACADCHQQKLSFTDDEQFSTGIDGIQGELNSMPLINLGLEKPQNRFFWNGRSRTLEEQALEPVVNPIEMHNTWGNVADVLNSIPKYVEMCARAFGSRTIDSIKVVKAVAQFERSLISSNSRYDKWRSGEPVQLTALEKLGLDLFRTDREEVNGVKIKSGADCFHCHGEETDFTDGLFHNNGLDLIPDSGRMEITGDSGHFGEFKTPTLRNLKYTAPYMHDGRFKTIEEVVDFYSEGLNPHSVNIDPLMKNKDIGGVHLTEQEKAGLKAFLLMLTDENFVNNPDFSDPNE